MTVNNYTNVYKPLFWFIILVSVVGCSKGRSRNCQGGDCAPKAEKDTIKTRVGYNVYLENSASMDGYVEGSSDFKRAVFGLLSDISLVTNGLADTMSLYYVNSETIPYTSDLKTFIADLSPADFRKRGGNRASSDIHKVLTTALRSVGGDTKVAVFISDCVFSPPVGKDAIDYLDAQGTSIKLDFASTLASHPDLATIVIQLKSSFKGTYYTFNNKQINLSASRPYYIWIMGETSEISKLLKTIKLENLKGGIEHYYALYPSADAAIKAEVLRQGQIGNFTISRANKLSIEEARASGRGEDNGSFGFSIGVDLSQLGVEASVLLDNSLYKVNQKNYTLTVTEVTEDDKRNNPTLSRFSHKINLKTQVISNETLTISFARQVPAWIDESHTTDDTNQSGAALLQTFGFKNMIEGVSEAYKSANKNQESLFSIQVTINK